MGYEVEVHGNSIEAALAKLRKGTKDIREQERDKQFFKKPSEKKREERIKSKRKMKQKRRRDDDDD